MRSALELREPWINWVRIVICIDSTHRRISVALRNRTLDLVPHDRLRYVTVVTLSQNRAIVSPLRNWLSPRRPLRTAIISLRLMDSRFWHGVHPPDTCWPPITAPPSLRLKHLSISSNPALVGKDLLPAVVGLPKTLVYRCWGAWGREKLLYYPEEVPYSCLCWFCNGPN